MVRLYSKQGCAPCGAVKNFFKFKGIEYEEFGVDSDEFAELAKDHDVRTVPIIQTKDRVIFGYNPSELAKI